MKKYNNLQRRAKLIRKFKENFSELFELHTDDELEVLWLYMNNPKEFDIVNNDIEKVISLKLYNKILERCPEVLV